MIDLIPYAAGVVTLFFGIAFYYFLEEVKNSK